jgi:bacillithiol biosynthesis cysteine-adding enzyme BshC
LPGQFSQAGRLDAAYPALYRDLTEAPARVAAFFPRPPAALAAWRSRAEEVMRGWAEPAARARRQAVVTALASAHAASGLTPAQEGNLARLAQEGSLVVVTGQQAGLFGGPLYTLYKALGALRVAAEAEAALGCPVVPVFWIASEDHDYSEVSRLRLAAADGRLLHLALPGHADFRSAGHIPVPTEARHLVGELEALFPPSATGLRFAQALRAPLQSARRPSLAEWFRAQLQALLGDRGLLFYDPMQPALRALAAPVFASAPAHAAVANARIREAGDHLRAAGYAPGLDLEPDHVHLFIYYGGRRLSLHSTGDRIRTKGGEVDLSLAELSARVHAEPTAFSPNVALRPVVQDFTLPVLVQLGGPGEVAYLAQLDGVFAAWDRAAPIVSPRPGATVVLPEDAAALGRAGVDVPALRSDLEGVLERVAAADCGVDLDALFAAARTDIDGRYVILEEELAKVSPHLPEIVRGNAARVRHQLAYLEAKAHQHRRRVRGDVVRGLRETAGRLFPGGALQERNSSVYPYVFRWGAAFIDALFDALGPAAGFGQHLLLRWDPEV